VDDRDNLKMIMTYYIWRLCFWIITMDIEMFQPTLFAFFNLKNVDGTEDILNINILVVASTVPPEKAM